MPIDAVRFVKGLHEEGGLRFEEIASVLKVTGQTVYNWTRGLAKPSPLAQEAIRKLAADLHQGGRGK